MDAATGLHKDLTTGDLGFAFSTELDDLVGLPGFLGNDVQLPSLDPASPPTSDGLDDCCLFDPSLPLPTVSAEDIMREAAEELSSGGGSPAVSGCVEGVETTESCPRNRASRDSSSNCDSDFNPTGRRSTGRGKGSVTGSVNDNSAASTVVRTSEGGSTVRGRPTTMPPCASSAGHESPKVSRRGRKRAPAVDWSSITDPEERKRQRRLAKNRKTAAVSRERKRLQMVELQDLVDQLTANRQELEAQVAQRDKTIAKLQEQLASLARGAGCMDPTSTMAAQLTAAGTPIKLDAGSGL